MAPRPRRRECHGRRPRRRTAARLPPPGRRDPGDRGCRYPRPRPASPRDRLPAGPDRLLPGALDDEAAVAAARQVDPLGGPGLRRPGLAGRRHRSRRRLPRAARLIAIVDLGLKANIVRSLRRRGARVRILPHTATATDILSSDVDGIVLSPGPGDPARLEGQVALAGAAIDDRPTAPRDLPRAPDRRSSRRGRHASAAVRPSRGEPSGPGRRHRHGRRDGPEPRGPGRRRDARRPQAASTSASGT